MVARSPSRTTTSPSAVAPSGSCSRCPGVPRRRGPHHAVRPRGHLPRVRRPRRACLATEPDRAGPPPPPVGLPLLAPGASSMTSTPTSCSSRPAAGRTASGTPGVIVYCYSPARWLYQTDTYLGGPPRSATGLALLVLRPPAPLGRPRRPPQRPLPRDLPRRARPDPRAYGIDAHVLPAPHSMDAGRRRPGRRPRGLGGRRLPPRGLAAAALQERRRRRRGRARHRTTGSSSSAPGRGATPCSPRSRQRAAPAGLTDAQLRWVYAHAACSSRRAIEDYGLSPLEAAAFGGPSLTLRAGGYLDTVREGVTGLHVDAPDPELFRAGLAAATPTRGTRRCCVRTPSASPRRASRRGCTPRSTTSCGPLSGLFRARAAAEGRPGPHRPNGPSCIRSVTPPCRGPGHARYWVGATPSSSRGGRPSDACHDVAKVP